MTDLRTAAQQALEALGKWSSGRDMDAVELNDLIATLEAALEQPEQDAVVGTKTWYEDGKIVQQNIYASEFYKPAPPRREWRGLTEEEFWPMLEAEGRADRKPVEIIAALARAIEQALRSKNDQA